MHTVPPNPQLHSGTSQSNIQEKTKNRENQIELVRSWLRSNTLIGTVLRTLVARLKHPERPYSSLDLEVLLLLTLAEMES